MMTDKEYKKAKARLKDVVKIILTVAILLIPYVTIVIDSGHPFISWFWDIVFLIMFGLFLFVNIFNGGKSFR